MKQLMVLLTQ